MAQFVTIGERNFEGGIDAYSAENSIQQGYVEDARNANFTENGYIEKRNGYITYGGGIPLRVVKAEFKSTTNELCLTFDASTSLETSIDLSNIRNTPLIVYGHLSNSSVTHPDFDFIYSSDKVQYYKGFTSDPRVIYPATSTTTKTLLGDEHGLGTINVFAGITQSTNILNNDNTHLIADTIQIDTTTFNADFTLTNGSPSDVSAFLYLVKKNVVPGTTYIHTAASVTSVTITATTHNLSNFNILVRCWDSTITSGKMTLVIPDSVVITPAGDATITFTSSFTGNIILTAVAPGNFVTGTIAASSTASINIAGLDGDFVFADPYLETTPGGNLELVLPDAVTVDAANDLATITFTNSSPNDVTFFIYYEATKITTNKLCVIVNNNPGISSWLDDAPQLTVWGLDHSTLYSQATSTRAGWVTHIDRYEVEGERRLVCGLGWNLFTDELQTSKYLMPTLYGNIRARTSGIKIIGPAFYDTTDSPSRSRGYIKFDGGGLGWARGTSVTYNPVTKLTKYTLSCPNINVVGTLSTIINTGVTSADFLTIEQAPFEIFNGTYKIHSVTLIANGLEIIVDNPNVTSIDYDSSDCGMLCGIFTDKIDLVAGSNNFIPGDIITSVAIPDDKVYEVVESPSDTVIRIGNVYEEFTILSGLLITGKRPKARILSLRNIDGTLPSNLNIVHGDMLSLAGYSREMRVIHVNPNGDEVVNVSGDGTDVTVTIASGTYRLEPGTYFMLTKGVYAGIHQVSELISNTQFKFKHKVIYTGTQTFAGKYVVLDEDVPNYTDKQDSSNVIKVPVRWVPIEAPVDSWVLTPVTNVKYFSNSSYTNQPYLRSVMANDNMYFTNGKDPIFKYDGYSIYRAGLIKWQPGQFITVVNEGTGNIQVPKVATPATCSNDANSAVIRCESGKEGLFKIGQLIKYSGTNEFYVINNITKDATHGLLTVDRVISSAHTSQTVARAFEYRYYFRLNVIDANDNIIGSAITGHFNHRVRVTDKCDIRIKLIGLPVLNIYDYDRLELEVYRTKANDDIFHRIKSVKLKFNYDNGYIIIQDFESDDTIPDNANLDVVSTAIRGSELTTDIRPPVRSKYITSAGNRLVLANIKSDPYIDFTFLQKSSVILSAASFAGHKYTIRKDNTNTSVITDMVSVATYEFINTAPIAISGITTGTGYFDVTSTGHGLSVGNWVYLLRHTTPAANQQVHFMGWYQVDTVVSANVFRIRMEDAPGTITFANEVTHFVKATDPRDIPVYLGTDYNFNSTNGNSSSPRMAVYRLASAINASMRQVNTTLSGFTSFVPWIVAYAGDEYGADARLILDQPQVTNTFFEVKLPSGTLDYEIFANNLRRNPGAEVSAVVEVKPSRLLASISGFPEIFDRPFSSEDSSISAIDINAADGQEITGVIPFFGDSAFGAAQKSGILVVFKSQSIYLVDLTEKRLGRNAVQKIESQGLGCTIPYSIAPTKDGIMFANEAGIYKLTRQLTIEYAGQYIERVWKENLDDSIRNTIQGHHYGSDRQYKLSMPEKGDKANSLVLVYNHTREAKGGAGSWSIYDNHPATGWVNFGADALFASTKGRVFKLRRNGDITDYRDDASPINFSVKFRALDFGEAGIRKRCLHIIVHFRNSVVDMTGSKFYSSINLKQDFQELDKFIVNTPYELNNLSDLAYQKITSIRFSMSSDKFLYLQTKLTNDKIDEPVQVTSIDYRVTGLTSKGTLEAADTTRSK